MRRPDESMSLLSDLQRDALDPAYREAAARGQRPSRVRLFLTLAALAALLAMAGMSTVRASGDVAAERERLLANVTEAEARAHRLEEDVRGLQTEIRALRDAQVADPALRESLSQLGAVVGDVPVAGPGVVIDIDDAAVRSGSQGLVFDSDLARLVNGLWQSGAEAVAINGRRVTALTAIRMAGSAITVDFVSLSPPYRVEAIGDPETLQARFARTAAAVWWQFIRDNYGVRFEISQPRGELRLPADPGMALRFAKAGG